MPELWRFEREKGGWEPQSTVVRKGRGGLPHSSFTLMFFWFPSSLFSLKPPEFRHKLNFFGPLLQEPVILAFSIPIPILRLFLRLVDFDSDSDTKVKQV